MSLLLECSRDNPFRPPDWRWRRAVGIVDGTQPRASRRHDGPAGFKWIKRAVAFKQALARASTDLDKRRVALDYQDIFWAHWAWHDPNNATRHQLEAYILAREADWVIGFKCGMTVAQVKAYANVFFDVRDKLDHVAYVINTIIGPSIHRGFFGRDYSELWKLYGYFFGTHALEAVVNKMVSPMRCSSPETVGTAFQDDAISTMKMKAALAAKTVPINAQTQIDLLHIFTKFIEVERTTDSAGRSNDQLLEHIKAALGCLPFVIGGRNPRYGDIDVESSPVDAFDNCAAELSYEESMLLSSGQSLPNAEGLRQIQYPAPASVSEANP